MAKTTCNTKVETKALSSKKRNSEIKQQFAIQHFLRNPYIKNKELGEIVGVHSETINKWKNSDFWRQTVKKNIEKTNQTFIQGLLKKDEQLLQKLDIMLSDDNSAVSKISGALVTMLKLRLEMAGEVNKRGTVEINNTTNNVNLKSQDLDKMDTKELTDFITSGKVPKRIESSEVSIKEIDFLDESESDKFEIIEEDPF